jgi:hypothetical protein
MGDNCLDLTGNSGAFKLYSNNNTEFISVSLKSVEENNARKITNFHGLQWFMEDQPDCNGAGDVNQTSCIQVNGDTTISVAGQDVSLGLEVFFYSETTSFITDGDVVNVPAGAIKYNINMGEWPSEAGSDITFWWDVASHGNSTSDGSIDYMPTFQQCCCGVCSTQDVNVTIQNWQQQQIHFPACSDGCATAIMYDPVISLPPNNPLNGGLSAGAWVAIALGGAVVVGAASSVAYTRNKSPVSEQEESLVKSTSELASV